MDHTLANLELMPSRMNSSKREAIGFRQRSLIEQLSSTLPVGAVGLKAVKSLN